MICDSVARALARFERRHPLAADFLTALFVHLPVLLLFVAMWLAFERCGIWGMP